MMVKQLEKAVSEAKRFLEAADILRKAGVTKYGERKEYWPGKNAAAVKRASMDLTKALADVRRYR